MKKADALKIATRLRTTYQQIKGCTEGRDLNNIGVKYIPLILPFAPTDEEVKGLSKYVLENEDSVLYSKTFGMMDIKLLDSICWKLKFAQLDWSEDIKYNLIIGDKAKVKELSGDKFLYIVEVYDNWKMIRAIVGEAMMLQPIFSNFIPPHDTSTPINPDREKVTDLVTSTENPTGASPDKWRLPIELDTPKAQGYFTKAVELGLMEINPNGCYLWKGTKKELALTAELMCERLSIPNKWKVFELAFKVKNLAQANYRAVEVDGKYSNNEKRIREIFEN